MVTGGLDVLLSNLASAGLVVRERVGREVRIQRTPRGDALVGLLS
ncbi:hypothetical protein GCM10009744_57710 [Kribbella alba]|uniref:Uncharacterized protein n=1 Tax=Kribbella alba TaxID=190197 RepID=A0ABN2FSF1_9ACTN